MTLTARVLVSDGGGTDIGFPEPGHEIVPRALGIAAQMLLDEDHRRGLPEVYEAIGYDARAARKHRAALAEKRRRDEAAGIEADEDDEIKQDFRIAVRAISLELMAGLFLSVLDSPEEARCPCRALVQDGKAVPYGPAPPLNPDARADYGTFTVIAEVTTALRPKKSDIAQQWDSAHRHVDAVAGVPRIYCLMVSRLGLDDRRKWQAARFAEARDKLEERQAPAAEVRFLVFDIEDMAEIAHRLHELYCEEGAENRPLTADGLGLLLEELHALTMEWVAGEEAFPPHWAGDTFIEMLGKYAAGKPIRDREAA